MMATSNLDVHIRVEKNFIFLYLNKRFALILWLKYKFTHNTHTHDTHTINTSNNDRLFITYRVDAATSTETFWRGARLSFRWCVYARQDCVHIRVCTVHILYILHIYIKLSVYNIMTFSVLVNFCDKENWLHSRSQHVWCVCVLWCYTLVCAVEGIQNFSIALFSQCFFAIRL